MKNLTLRTVTGILIFAMNSAVFAQTADYKQKDLLIRLRLFDAEEPVMSDFV